MFAIHILTCFQRYWKKADKTWGHESLGVKRCMSLLRGEWLCKKKKRKKSPRYLPLFGLSFFLPPTKLSLLPQKFVRARGDWRSFPVSPYGVKIKWAPFKILKVLEAFFLFFTSSIKGAMLNLKFSTDRLSLPRDNIRYSKRYFTAVCKMLKWSRDIVSPVF